MMTRILFLIVLIPWQAHAPIPPRQTPERPQPEARETEWTKYLALTLRGEAEHRLPCGARVDVLTERTAWEVEWPDKWAESIGQAVYYRASSGRQGGVILLMGRHPAKQELIHYMRCLVATQSVDLKLRVCHVRAQKNRPSETSK